MEEVANASADSNDPSKQGNISEAVPPTAHEVSAKSSTILVLTFVGRVWAMDAKGVQSCFFGFESQQLMILRGTCAFWERLFSPVRLCILKHSGSKFLIH